MLCNGINLVPTGLEHTYAQPAALFKHNLRKGSILPQILALPAAMMGNQMSPTLVMLDTTDFHSDPIQSTIQAGICDTDPIPLATAQYFGIDLNITTLHRDKHMRQTYVFDCHKLINCRRSYTSPLSWPHLTAQQPFSYIRLQQRTLLGVAACTMGGFND